MFSEDGFWKLFRGWMFFVGTVAIIVLAGIGFVVFKVLTHFGIL